MRRNPGDKVANIRLPAIDGSMFELDSLKGKRYLLSFFRFAGCPFCNLRLHELAARHGELGNDFAIVAIFDSPLQNLQRHAAKHEAPFPILADQHNIYYREYGIEYSLSGILKGVIRRMPALLSAIFVKGYFPASIQGRLTTLPADFLIDENGMIHTAYYGKDEGDHLPFEQAKAFALDKKTGREE